MAYVSGRGGYGEPQRLDYLGFGGDLQSVQPRKDSHLTLLVTVLLCLGVILLPFACWWHSELAARPKFDCTRGYASWQTTWSHKQKAYCCSKVGRGCAWAESTTAAPQPQPSNPGAATTPRPIGDPYNCAVGKDTWKTSWSPAKKKWCCDVHHLGCAHSTTPRVAILPPLLVGTLPPTTHATTKGQEDCSVGYETWMASWSLSKKAWCCANTGKGCEPGLEVVPAK